MLSTQTTNHVLFVPPKCIPSPEATPSQPTGIQPKRYQLPPLNQGTIHKSFHKATLNPGFEEANKTQKATKLLQSAVESTASEIEATHDNRFASACNLIPNVFDPPMTAAIRTGQWEYQHTVLHPEGIATHFGLHHIASTLTRSAIYKTRIEGASKIIPHSQVYKYNTTTAAKVTDLYHSVRMGNLNHFHELIHYFSPLSL